MQVSVRRGLVRLFGCGIPVGALASSVSAVVVLSGVSVVMRAKCWVVRDDVVGFEDATGRVVMMASNALVSASRSVGERDALGVGSVLIGSR